MADSELVGSTVTYRHAVVWGEGPAADAIAGALAACRGWTVALVAGEDQAKAQGVQARRLWIAVHQRRPHVEGYMILHPTHDLLAVVPETATVMDRCRLWELGAVVVQAPVFPREVVAIVRNMWRAAFRHAG